MFIAFFDIDGVVHHGFVLRGHTVNGHFYVQILQSLRDAVRRNVTAELRKILKNLPLVLPKMAGSMEQVCVRARARPSVLLRR